MSESAICNLKSAIPLWHRFPKWLGEERYEIAYSPALAEPFSVILFDNVSRRYEGSGHSIGRAAKAALKKRDVSQNSSLVTGHSSLSK